MNKMKESQFTISPNPSRFLQKTDLFLLPKGYSITDVAYNRDKLDAIGIEVKYNIEKRNLKKIISQLNSYADSGALTRLYLAIPKESDLVEKLKNLKDRKFGLMIYKNGEPEIILESPKLEIRYDKLAYTSSTGYKITIYEFGKPKPISQVIYHLDLNKLNFYGLIYVRLSSTGASYVIDFYKKY